MRYFVIIITVLLVYSNPSYSAKKTDCSDLKKYSIQYTWCKSKNAGKSIKDKISGFNKNKSDKNKNN